MSSTRDAEIRFVVTLDEESVPESIGWEADDADFDGVRPCESIMVSIWDHEEGRTLTIDLWTKEMLVEEMDAFFYQTLMQMADTYRKATRKDETADSILAFARRFGEATGLLDEDGEPAS